MLINDASITGSLIVNASASFQNISVGGNIIPDTTNIRNLGSTDKYFKEIYVSTGSINFVDGGSVVAVLSAGTITAIQSNTSSANSRLNSIESVSASLQSFTASISTTNTFTSSATARLNALETITSSNIARLNSIETITSSNIARLNAVETITASNVARLNSLEIKTGSLATTGSNTFIGTQTITGSLFISSDLVVQGSSSLQNITASAVSIGTNLINLNTANPAIRYAGLSIGDSGSIGSSGSFLYDSVQDEFIFVHRGANTTVTSSVVLMGPQTFDNIGSETYPTLNIVQKGTGNEHLVDSCIFDNGTTTCIKNNLVGTGTACFTGVVCGLGFYASSLQSGVTIDSTTNGDTIIASRGLSSSLHGIVRTIGQNGVTCMQMISTRNSVDGNLPASVNAIWGLTNSDMVIATCNTERMRITSGGNVGIGNVSPTVALDVTGAGRVSGNVGFGGGTPSIFTGYSVASFGSLSTTSNGITIASTTTGNGLIEFADGTTGNQAYRGYLQYAHTADSLSFGTAGSDRMIITCAGNIGIGATPCAWAAPTAGKVIQLGNRASLFSYNNNTLDLATNFYFDGGDYRYIQSAYASLLRGDSSDGTFVFYNASSGTAGGVVSLNERLRISNNGTISTTCNLSVGTSVDAGGGFGTMIAYQPYGAASFSCNLNVLPDGTYIVTASMVRGGDGINQTYSAMFIYHHYIGSGGTDIINTIVSSTAPGNNNGQLSLSGTTISIGWGGARGPASISALRLRTI